MIVVNTKLSLKTLLLSTDCKFNCHKKCSEQAPKNCLGEMLMYETGMDQYKLDTINMQPLNDYFVILGSATSYDSGNISETLSEMDLTDEMQDEQSIDDECRNTYTLEEPPSPSSSECELSPSSNYIPLQRVVVSVKHTKRKGSKILKQGWMVHFTNKEFKVSSNLYVIFMIVLIMYGSNIVTLYREKGITGVWTPNV